MNSVDLPTLLICVCFHYNAARYSFLETVVNHYKSFKTFKVTIIIDTNTSSSLITKLGDEVYEHTNLIHPFSLTSKHRDHFIKYLNNFDYFMYIEDDMIVPEQNISEYLINFKTLYPKNLIPSFIRLEEYNNQHYIVDITQPQINRPKYSFDHKLFANLTQPYHAFWILPQKELIDSIDANFNKDYCIGRDNREQMASYCMWYLKKTPLVMLDSFNKISELCYSYHIANNYVKNLNTKFGKTLVKDLIIT